MSVDNLDMTNVQSKPGEAEFSLPAETVIGMPSSRALFMTSLKVSRATGRSENDTFMTEPRQPRA